MQLTSLSTGWSMGKIRILIACWFVGGLLILSACGKGEPLTNSQQTKVSGEFPKTVLVLTIDTLRQDHVGFYGDGIVPTPELDRFFLNGVVFDQMRTPIPVTACPTSRPPVRTR